ncbi:hypothetical protein EST38_g4589 [Candolleomyces aberdarensis]|uniref:SHSP domain-containing protein n=1 Tax=Candolleomyces aberdarensis TaxID=2316362 RepID=A0A4Q2DPB6_9AGAR|nr:hypothetical protein EST38_g4589 [Candolleomyces aberdarensis]
MPPYNQYQRRDYLSSHDKPVRSPVTPAVTGIDYPVEDASTDIESRGPRGYGGGQQFYTLPNIAASSIDDPAQPPSNASSLDQVWNSIRQQKERRMAKEKPKVQSLEEVTQELLLADQHPPMPIPVVESHSSVPKSLKKHKSICNLRESTDGRSIVATFELPVEVSKPDIHVSFQRNKLILTWEYAEIEEWMEDGVLNRERTLKHFHRTVPLPEGTRFEEIHAQMTNRGLILRYPNMRTYRIEPRSRSGDS